MISQKQSLAAAVITIWVILLLQAAASFWHLYWVWPWFDILMHFLGGLWLGFILYVLLLRLFPQVQIHRVLFVFLLISGALFFGFLWEIMEFIIDLFLGTHFFQPNLPDTLIDLTMDIAGAAVAALGIIFIFKKHE